MIGQLPHLRALLPWLAMLMLVCTGAVGSAHAQDGVRVFERLDRLSPQAKLAIETDEARTKLLPPQRGFPELLGYVRMNVRAFQPTADSFAKQFVFNLAETLEIKLDLPGGANIRAQLAPERAPGTVGITNWTGQVADSKDSSVTITYFEGGVTGKITFPTVALKLRRTRDDVYAVEKINEKFYPNEAHPQKRSDLDGARPQEDARDLRAQCAKDPAIRRLRVLVLYTDAAEKYAGSSADLVRTVGNIVGESNLALKNSEVRIELELAGIAKASVVRDEDSGKYLGNLAGEPGVQQLRKQHKAHVVSLVDDLPSHYTYCGVGYIPERMPPLYKEGYSVADIGCAIDKYTFVHEIGHNLGAGHDKDNGDGLFAYSSGLQWQSKFRSIMAYACGSATPCDRIPRFTNPNRTFSGETIGDSTSADNARTLNEVRCFIAGWQVN